MVMRYKTEMLNEVVVHESGRQKTICTSAVLAFFGIGAAHYHYCQNRKDMERILRRKGWSVRSRLSKVGKGCTVGKARERIAKLGEGGHYYVSVPGHAMLLDSKGQTVVDTAPRKRDRRKVLAITKISRTRTSDSCV